MTSNLPQNILLFIASLSDLLKAFHEINNLSEEDLNTFEPIHHWHSFYELTLDELHALNAKTLEIEGEVDHIAKSPDRMVSTVNMIDRSVVEADDQSLDNSSVFTAYYPLMKSYMSIIYNKMSLNEMVFKIASSKNPADLIKRALKIDKTIIHCAPVAYHIKKAQLLNDKKLLKAVSIGLTTSFSNKSKVKFPELVMTLYELNRLDQLHKLSNEDLYQICVEEYHFWPDKEVVAKKEAKGLYVDKDPESFRKEVTRIKKSLKII
jgi:hypothetical protein